jgi:hypothetical protein
MNADKKYFLEFPKIGIWQRLATLECGIPTIALATTHLKMIKSRTEIVI